MPRKNLFDQRRSAPRHADDEDRTKIRRRRSARRTVRIFGVEIQTSEAIGDLGESPPGPFAVIGEHEPASSQFVAPPKVLERVVVPAGPIQGFAHQETDGNLIDRVGVFTDQSVEDADGLLGIARGVGQDGPGRADVGRVAAIFRDGVEDLPSPVDLSATFQQSCRQRRQPLVVRPV